MSSLTLLLVLAIAVASIKAAGFCYHEENCGPTHWSGVCLTGRSQSPINIDSWTPLKAVRSETITFSDAYKQNIPSAVILNNGHTVQISANTAATSDMYFTSSLTGSTRYNFGQIHCHWGAEHTIGATRYRPDIECHAVHYNSSSYKSITEAVAAGKPGALAIFAIFYTVSSSAKPLSILTPDPTFKLFTDNIAKVVDPEKGSQAMSGTVNIYNMIPRTTTVAAIFSPNSNDNFQFQGNYYRGSLTTPGCTEGMHWFVMRTLRQITVGQLQTFRTLLDEKRKPLYNNYRPTQNLNGRAVDQVMFREVNPVTTGTVLAPNPFSFKFPFGLLASIAIFTFIISQIIVVGCFKIKFNFVPRRKVLLF